MKKKSVIIGILLASIMYLLGLWILNSKDPLLQWDWQSIDTSKKPFPKHFVWGVASSAHQVEGGHQNINNFGRWEQQTKPNGDPTILNNDKSGDACDHWNRYPEDIKLMTTLGVDAYRFSISWSKIMPKKNVVDSLALQHYVNVADSLLNKGIKPMVTFHHFTHPIWFADMGAFEKEDNIKYFVDFSETVYMALKDRVKEWCTINEPGIYMVGGYLSGLFPPGVEDPDRAALVLENLMKAHVQVYQRIKSLPEGQHAQIGIVKNMMQMDAYSTYNLFDHLIKFIVDNNYNEVILNLFKTNEFDFYMPTMADRKCTIEGANTSLDFVGLNYYSHYAFNFNGNIKESIIPRPFPGETMTDMDYGMYPEGIYRAIKRISELKVPIIITENGIADDKDDRRAEFIDKYLYAVSKAIEDGYDVRGYYYWSLMDNFEWSLGYGERFGLYHVDFNSQKRTLKEAAKTYLEIIKQAKSL